MDYFSDPKEIVLELYSKNFDKNNVNMENTSFDRLIGLSTYIPLKCCYEKSPKDYYLKTELYNFSNLHLNVNKF